MKTVIVFFSVVFVACTTSLPPRPLLHRFESQPARCVNMWDEGCINGQIPGSGGDDNYLGGSLNPGKRCANMWDDGCVNGQLTGSGGDDNYLGGNLNPGKRCVNMWDDGCTNGQLTGSGGDDNYLGGNLNPGKRSWHGRLLNMQGHN